MCPLLVLLALVLLSAAGSPCASSRVSGNSALAEQAEPVYEEEDDAEEVSKSTSLSSS